MWIINIIFLLLLFVGYVISRKYQEEILVDIDKKEHTLYFLYPLAEWIIARTGLGKILQKKNSLADSLKALYVTSKPELQQKLYWCRRISLIIMVLALFHLFSLVSYLADLGNSSLIDGRYIKRPGYGEGDSNVRLYVSLETSDYSEGENQPAALSETVIINVKERLYTAEETKLLFSKAFAYLKQEVLGENEAAEFIDQNLNFSSSIPGTSLTVVWQPKDYNLISSEGAIYNENIGTEGITTSVKVVLSYYEQKAEQDFYFKLMPKQFSEEELINQALSLEVKESGDDSAYDALYGLPLSIDGYKLSWKAVGSNNEELLLIFGFAVAVLIWLYGDKELEHRMQKRKEQMLLDYPEIINKFTLLVNAGMTIKQAWCKITEDYSAKTAQNASKKRYAYEEMAATVRELKLGLPESTAYEQFGRRTGLIAYIKFGSLVTQNLKKGTKGFTELLMGEAMDSFEERKETAKRLGEEAGTKLLIPMMIMLIIVFLMIMIPAFSSFSI